MKTYPYWIQSNNHFRYLKQEQNLQLMSEIDDFLAQNPVEIDLAGGFNSNCLFHIYTDLERALLNNTSVKWLNLCQAGIINVYSKHFREVGYEAIMRICIRNKIEFLDISRDHIDKKNIDKLLNVIQAGYLKYLNLGDNDLEDKQLIKLLDALSNDRIIKLDISNKGQHNCSFKEKGLFQLEIFLINNSSLVSLSLEIFAMMVHKDFYKIRTPKDNLLSPIQMFSILNYERCVIRGERKKEYNHMWREALIKALEENTTLLEFNLIYNEYGKRFGNIYPGREHSFFHADDLTDYFKRNNQIFEMRCEVLQNMMRPIKLQNDLKKVKLNYIDLRKLIYQLEFKTYFGPDETKLQFKRLLNFAQTCLFYKPLQFIPHKSEFTDVYYLPSEIWHKILNYNDLQCKVDHTLVDKEINYWQKVIEKYPSDHEILI